VEERAKRNRQIACGKNGSFVVAGVSWVASPQSGLASDTLHLWSLAPTVASRPAHKQPVIGKRDNRLCSMFRMSVL
jgi:hypothetical protein